jgi:hypothetical protein
MRAAEERHTIMSHLPGNPDRATIYHIRLAGHLDPQWADWFDGLRVSLQSDGTTLLSGPVIDQAALHGLLKKVRDLGLPLIAVNQVDSDSHKEQ